MRKRKRITSLVLACALVLGLFIQAGLSSVVMAEEDTSSPYITSTNWIWSSDTYTKNTMSYFRKEVQLDAPLTKLEIKTSAHNYMKFYVNGNLITGLSTPATSTVPENKNYLSYTFEGDSLTPLLDGGSVTFGAMVQYLGDYGMNYVNGAPGFWAEIVINGGETIVTDTSWQALADTPYKNNTPSQSGRRMNAQLDYDARKMPDPAAFAKNGYDTTTYTAGTWKNAIPAKEETFTYKMRQQGIPEGAVHDVIIPTKVGTQSDSVQVFDAGRIVSGFPRFKISAPAGTRVCLRYSEDLENGRVKHNVANEYSSDYCDYYTFSGEGVEEFCPDFNFKAFRYFEIEGLGFQIEPGDIVVEWASTGVENTSTFNSSNGMMNAVYEACINTQYNNMQMMPVDCPHREQAQYLGDSQMQYDLLSYAFSDFNSINYKTLLDFAGAQLEDGSFPFITPTNVEAFDLKIPEYDLRYPDLLWQYYYYSGKTDALQEFYSNAAKVTEKYYGYVDGTGMVATTPYWSISDWPSSAVDDSGRYHTTMNLHMWDALTKMAKIAELLGKSGDAADYQQRADEMATAITLNLIDPSTGLYMDSSGSSMRNPGVTAFGIYLGHSPEVYRKQQLDYIAETELNVSKGSPLPSKVILTKPVLHVLLNGDASHKEAAFELMTRTTGIEWGTFINEGYQTCWEGFERMNSHSHAWTAYPARMVLQYLVGISYNDVNYSGVTVKPYVPEGETFVEGSLQIPDGGAVSSRLETNVSRNSYTLTVSTPVNTKIGVPRIAMENTMVRYGNSIVFQDGQAADVSGVTYVGDDSQYIYFNVAAGSHIFTSEVKASTGDASYTLQITGTEGGTVKVGGEEVELPYTASIEAGAEIELTAVPDSGMKFDGWSGLYASEATDMSFAMKHNTVLNAAFSANTDKVVHALRVDGPDSSGLYVEYNGGKYNVPGVIPVLGDKEVTLTAGQYEAAKYNFVAWSGEIFDARETITLSVNKDINLEIIGEYAAIENLAAGGSVTTNSGYQEGMLWRYVNLTDGYTGVGPDGQLGFTSGAYASQDISADPHKVTIDLGNDRELDTVILYPRADATSLDGGSVCFPESYQIQLCKDGSDQYVTVAEVTDGGNPGGRPRTATFDAATGRYLRIVSTKLGEGMTEGGAIAYRVQFTEAEAYLRNSTSAEVALNIDGTGHGAIKVNGQLENLPYSDFFPLGSHVVVEAVADDDYRSTGWSGDLTAGYGPVYLQMNRDIYLETNFKSLIAAKSENYALGKTATAKNSDGAAPQWGVSNLTDGLTVSTGTTASDGIKGYTSVNYDTQIVSEEDAPWIEIDLGKDTDFHQVALYPRTDIAGADGGSPNFPVDYKIMYKMDGDEIYRTIGDFTDVENPNGQPVELNFGIQNGRYIRIVPTKFGSPAADDAGSARPYRFQLAEVEVYAVPMAPDNLATGATITAKDMAANAGAWAIANLVDGKLRSEGRGLESGIKGFTSAARSNGNNDISSDPFWLQYSFTQPRAINQFVMYPRSDVDANTQNSGDSANFPVSFKLQVKNESTGQMDTVYEVENFPNPGMAPVEINFPTVMTSLVRLEVSVLGMPSYDELSKAHYVQLAETRISYVSAESIEMGSIDLSLESAEPITTLSYPVGVFTDIVPSDLGNDGLRWSLETEDGFVSDIAALTGTDTDNPKLIPLKGGTVYVTARFNNGIPVIDRLSVTIVGKNELVKAIEEAEGLTKEYYTSNSWAALESALEEAVRVRDLPEASQDEVDEATRNLKQAMEDLVFQYNRYEEFTDEIEFWGSWAPVGSEMFSARRAQKSVRVGDSTAFTFEGKAFKILSYTSASQGQVDIAIDGLTVAKGVDLYAPNFDTGFGHVLFDSGTLDTGRHTVVVTISGKNAQAIANGFYFDAVDVVGSLMDYEPMIADTTVQLENSNGATAAVLPPNATVEITNGQYGTVAVENGRVIYTPTAMAAEDSFTYTVNGQTATVTVNAKDGIRYEDTFFGTQEGWTRYNAASYSGGTALRSAKQGSAIEFSFKGTGFDVISYKSFTRGKFQVVVKDSGGNTVANKEIDCWDVSADTLFQNPVYRLGELENDVYTVTITVLENKAVELDAVDIYW